jgi:hypothetical protein
MRLVFLMVAAMALATPVAAQQPTASSADGGTPASNQVAGDLPVSLDRIREQLNKPEESRLHNLDVKPDFTVQIAEQRRIDEIMSKLDFKTGPAPGGGLYGYEQQRMLFNPTDHPLQQPYAAFSGSEFATIAIQNLIARYLGGRILSAVSSAERERAEAQARGEVEQAIAEYCSGRPDHADITLCTTPPER